MDIKKRVWQICWGGLIVGRFLAYSLLGVFVIDARNETRRDWRLRHTKITTRFQWISLGWAIVSRLFSISHAALWLRFYRVSASIGTKLIATARESLLWIGLRIELSLKKILMLRWNYDQRSASFIVRRCLSTIYGIALRSKSICETITTEWLSQS